MRGLLGRVADLKTLDGFLNLSWNTDQLHRLARGQEPDLEPRRAARPRWPWCGATAGSRSARAGHRVSRAAYDLTDKVVLITGGNGGIGAATGRDTARPGSQRRDRRHRPVDAGAGRRPCTRPSAFGCVADVRDRASLDEAVAQTVDRFGRLDVVIANAGLLAKAATLRNTPTADVEATLAVNVTGVANTVA